MDSEAVRGNPRLVINPGAADSWEVPLHAGTNTLGRTSENDVPLEHSSVSSSHCEIIISNQGARLKDLGSTNGTFVGGELVEEVLLFPGQRVQIGSVETVFEWELARTPFVAQVKPLQANSPQATNVSEFMEVGVSTAEQVYCRFHKRTPARFSCPKCRHGFCEICVNTRQQGGAAHKFCRTCGVECIPLLVQPPESMGRPAGFARLAAGAFGYPFKGDGIILLAAGTIVYGLLDAASFFAGFALFFGLVAIGFLSVFGFGYLTAYMRRILTSSAMGEGAMPDWPDFSDIGSDIVSPFLQLIATVGACFVPAVVLALLLGREHEWKDVAVGGAYLFGAIYFPMAFLAVAMFDTVAALNPILVLPSMVKVGKEYLWVLFLFALILVARWAKDEVVTIRMPIVVRLLYLAFSSFLSLYLATVAMRVLGLLYFSKKLTLGWFTR